MPTRVRYHAQRRHVIYSLDALLYELHTLSFLLSPSLFILLTRCITQFQFARVRELDGRRSLAFWLGLVGFVNVSAVWSHAVGEMGGAGRAEKGVVLDFVGMGHRPTRLQLLLLDATIIFLQALLNTIAYETSLALVMPADVADPLLPASTILSASQRWDGADEERETAPFIPYSSPELDYDRERSGVAGTSTSSNTPFTYPPPPPITSSSSLDQNDQTSDPLSIDTDFDTDTKPPAPSDPLPPNSPVISLSLTHIIHRLTSPIPSPPTSSRSPGTGMGDEGLDGEDDELAVLRLPLPNTTSVRVAHTLRMLAQTRQRQRQRDQQMARRLRRAGAGAGGGSGTETSDASGRGRGRNDGGTEHGLAGGGRIPGAIEDEDEG